MTKKKSYKNKTKPLTGSDRINHIQIFNSFEEQDNYELKKMAALSSIEILAQLRKFINIAYGMHGYDPHKLPTTHSIKIKHT